LQEEELWAKGQVAVMVVAAHRFCLCVLALLVLSQPSLLGAPQPQTGPQIFRQLCAKCHGGKGQGVKGKYDDALQGDWSMQKLTRYIDKKMPEDDPGRCRGADAEAVARYIYDAFYSRQAHMHGPAPRIEVLHLTNRQYANAVADLIHHFTGQADPLTEERGLRAVYYDSREFDGDKKVIERIERQVGFDFGAGKWDPKLNGTNGFSAHWKGSLVAPETGNYEFVLKTANGARLWINDEEDPIIDGWVGGGQVAEQRAALHLIGGRTYPFRLDYFRFKEKSALLSLHWKPPHGVEENIPARDLLPGEVAPTLVINTPFPPDDSSVGYERGMGVSKAWDEATTHAAIEAANYVVKRLDALSHSKPSDTNRLEKVQTFCGELVATAFRRPLTAEQKRLFVSAQFKSASKTEDAVKRVVLLALKSPRFLYLGLEGGKPDDFQVAERLSFALWDSLPDAELERAAAGGQLRTEAQVSDQARRMLADPRAHSKMLYFLQQWLQMNQREDLSKDATLFPGFTPEIIADLRVSLNLFLEEAIWSGPSDYRSLLLADYLFLNRRLARFYGVQPRAGEDFQKIPFDPKQRCGVITHPYLLAAFSYQKSTSPIHRGVFLTRNIVGRALKPPPMAMTFKDADFATNLTMREKVAQLTRPQACQSCHSVINPLGFSLEHYDAVGRFRQADRDRPIDSVSDYVTDAGETVHLAGPRDIAEFAAGSEQAQDAFIEHLFNQMVKEPMRAYGEDEMERLRQAMVASQFNVRKLMVNIATVSALHGVAKTTAVGVTSVDAAGSRGIAEAAQQP
jgi:Protein of unknown function (DUF1592)/Protein of unknown function (DUF1588)/PA14 domain/Cytochrome C oxidase, cbb3-type, subunit III